MESWKKCKAVQAFDILEKAKRKKRPFAGRRKATLPKRKNGEGIGDERNGTGSFLSK